MSANVTATFTDYTPGHLRRKVQQPAAATEQSAIFSDMADGNLVTEFFFKFANFDYAASNLVLTLIGILGDAEENIKLFDEDIANVAKCNERTVRRWRASYLEQAQKQNFFPLEIVEGEYDHMTQRYKATSYRITFADALERAVATARARPEYKTDRRAAIEKAAEIYYDDIPQAPSRMRTRKPRKAAQTPIAHLSGASKKITSAQASLEEMPSRQRDAFINGQGEELRGMLEALRQQIAELESCLETGETENVSVENTEVEIVRTFCPVSPPLCACSCFLVKAFKTPIASHCLPFQLCSSLQNVACDERAGNAASSWCRYSPIITYRLLSDAVLKTEVALFRKAQGMDARPLCLAKLNHNILRFQFIFKISRARPDVAVASFVQ